MKQSGKGFFDVGKKQNFDYQHDYQTQINHSTKNIL